MNRNGQGLIAALVLIAILGIVAQMFTSLMVGVFRQQARVQRTNAWQTVQANVLQLLKNQQSCAATLGSLQSDGSLRIMISPITPYIASGTVLAPSTTIASVTIALAGPAAQTNVHFDAGVGNCYVSGNGGNHNGGCDATGVQQGMITVEEIYARTNEHHTATFVVNMLYNSSAILGCSL